MKEKQTPRRRAFKEFFRTFDTPGGHIAICLTLLIIYGHFQGVGLGHDIAIFALSVLSRSMGTTPPESPEKEKKEGEQ